MFKKIYHQEDISPRSSRLRRAQVSYLFSQCCYLHIFVISVWCFRTVTKRASVVFRCVLFCFFFFRSRSHPVPHRGERRETRNGTSQKYCPYYVTELSIVPYAHPAIIPALDIRFGWNFFVKFVGPLAAIWLWKNLTLIAITEIFKT